MMRSAWSFRGRPLMMVEPNNRNGKDPFRLLDSTIMSGLPLNDQALRIIRQHSAKIEYSDKYFDDINEYRHVILPKEISKLIPKGKLLSDPEWRSLGVQQSLGWEHYMNHRPEPHILLFRRPKHIGAQQEKLKQAAQNPIVSKHE
eukprot:NODE_389_length_1551_cov_243.268309_g282_i0.p1 GENE.NODE_389_length_1551_cov_243.268309_g282_i0~~NODE_389_length_1551_cov_243.268309_g282_i0.p1  ORF type:complete len:145 (+),score=22.62 NODE_389_length_1551_cov_243.268309_g282_i0:705-1139(+)